jgi:cytochrome c553
MNRLGKSSKVLEIAIAAVGLSVSLSTPAALAAEPGKPDLARGQAIATQVCAACHGADGNSASGAYPKLAGQHAAYLITQLKDFRPQPGGKPAARGNPTMAGFASALSDQDIINVAAYFSSQTPKPGYARNAATVPLGQKIWRAGIADRGVPACAGCHGPTGQGIPVQYPRLSGQWAEYVAAQLVAFQDETRENSEPMHEIAHRLSSDEIKAVSDFVAGLH